MKSPCQYCTDRTITCHGFCKRYQEWKKEREETLARIAEEKKRLPELNKRTMRHIWRSMKRK